MPVRVEDIVRVPGLALTVVAGRAGLDRTIRWVHVSELEDPTPWLKGGEVLLTTGMGIGETPAKQRAYVRRLSDAGLAGLGFGVGFGYERTPKPIVEAAERLGFPVLEVPYPVPFIAITEAVSSRLAAEQLQGLQRSLDAQQELTRVVLDGAGVAGIVAALARTIGGWAVLVDVRGIPLAWAPGDAEDRARRIWDDLRESRPQQPGFSLSLVDGGDHVTVQPVGARGRVEGFLAAGKEDGLAGFDRVVTSHALSMLAVELGKSREVADAERRLKGDFLDALVREDLGETEIARGLRRFGLDPDGEVKVVAIQSGAPLDDLAWATDDVLSRTPGGFLTAPRDDALFVVIRPDGDRDLEELRDALAERVGPEIVIGAGSPVRPPEVARSLREARYALRVCRVEGRSVADFRQLGTYRLLLSLQEPDALRAFAESVLSPLERYDNERGGELIESLRAFLEHNARWETASAELFVHRHTLRYRIRKIEELTGRDLGSPHDRMEFWLALRARELLARTAE